MRESLSRSVRRVGFAWLILCAWLLYSFWVTRHRMFWGDELFGWTLITDRSFHHMAQAWQTGPDGGGFAFYALSRWWIDVFGHFRFAFRSFSVACCWAAFCIMWAALRRYYTAWIATCVLTIVFLGSVTIRWQLVQGRFYGMLLAGASLLLLLIVRSADNAAEKHVDWWLALQGFAVSALLVNTHPLGLVYGATLAAGAAADDLLAGRRRPSLFAGVVAGWGTLLFSVTALRNIAAVGKPWFWTSRPHLKDLRETFVPEFELGRYTHSAENVFQFALLVLVVAACVMVVRKPAVRERLRLRRSILLPAGSLLLVPPALFLLSQGATSLFVGRYMIVTAMGVAVLLAEGVQQIREAARETNGKPQPAMMFSLATVMALALALAFVVFETVARYPKLLTLPAEDFTSALADQLPKDAPVVIVRPDVFMTLVAGRPATALQPVFLLDWGPAVQPQSPRWMVSAFHDMEDWKKAGYYSSRISPAADFLSAQNSFYVLDATEVPSFMQPLAASGQWRMQPLERVCFGLECERLWRVTRL